jgi:signal transduction histidine kinase
VRSLHAVSEGMEQLARGEFGNEIEVTSNDEIGDLARQANRTALRLREYRDRTEALVTETRRQAELLQDANADLQRTSAELREKVADLENVSNTLSHDLRAPLRSIRAFSEVLAESLHDKIDADADARDALQRVLRGGERMGRMLDDLYRLLRISGAEVSAGEVSIMAVLNDVTQNLKTDLEQAGATVTHGELPTIRSNALLIGQILQNLIANAIKFHGPERPVVTVDVTRRPSDWEFSVRDNGIGIAPGARERVFRLFERLSSNGSGTGVGLALCKRAVEKLGGRIWIDAHDGPGTTFAFAIPHEPQGPPRDHAS